MRTESNLNTTCMGLSDECKKCTMGKAIKTVACIVMEQVGDTLWDILRRMVLHSTQNIR